MTRLGVAPYTSCFATCAVIRRQSLHNSLTRLAKESLRTHSDERHRPPARHGMSSPYDARNAHDIQTDEPVSKFTLSDLIVSVDSAVCALKH